MKKNPCKDCQERHRACHDKCEKYKSYKLQLDKIHKAISKDNERIGFEIKEKERFRKRYGR